MSAMSARQAANPSSTVEQTIITLLGKYTPDKYPKGKAKSAIVYPANVHLWLVDQPAKDERQILHPLGYQRQYPVSLGQVTVTDPQPFAWINEKGELVLPRSEDGVLLEVMNAHNLQYLNEIQQQRLVQYLRLNVESDPIICREAYAELSRLDNLEYEIALENHERNQ